MNAERPPKFPDFLSGKRVVWPDPPSVMDVMLDQLAGYVTTMESSLEEKSIPIQERYGRSDDPRVRDYFEGGLIVVKEIFPHLLRSSFFLTAYSLLEYGLLNRCRCVAKSKNLPFSAKELAGGGYIQKYKKYLEEQGDIQGFSEWETLEKYQQLRNRVVHYQGHLNARNEKLMDFIAGNPGLSTKSDGIVVKRGFCEEVVETLRKFFQNLDAQLPVDCDDLDLESLPMYYDY